MKTAHAVLLFLGMLFFVFCGRESESTYLRDMLSSFEAKSIHFPEKMLCVENGVPGFRDVCISLPTLIIYVGPDECNDCALAHLLEKDTLFKWAEESKSFQVYVIFSPSHMDVPEILEKITAYRFPFPVYIDTEGYLHEQKAIPDDTRFHCFLLDRTQHPVLVGNPLGNTKMETLFWSVLRTI